jgi:tight adherence protein B
MALLLLMFLSILLASFGLVIALTRPSQQEKTISQRMTLIHIARKNQAGATVENEQLLKQKNTGSFAWLDEILEPYRFAQSLQKRILQANSSTTVAKLIASCFGLFLLAYAITWLFAPMLVLDLPCALAFGILPYGVLTLKRARRIAAFNAVLPECIDMLGRALRAGHSVAGAMEMLAQNAQEPAASEFGEMFRQQNLGLPLREALMQLLDRVPSADLRVLVTAILVQRDTGGNLVEIMDRTVFVIRERLRIRGEIQVQTAQGRLTGWILSGLPVAMLVLLNLLNPGYSSILFSDPFGRKLIYSSAGMLAVGALIIRHIVNGIEV